MILKNISFVALLMILFSTVLSAESHDDGGVKEEFNNAIKHVEKKREF